MAGDFNGDGILDLAVTNRNGADVTILLGKGDGTFTATDSGQPSWSSDIAVGDFNGDGILDLVVGGAVLLGNGDGIFTATASPSTGGSYSAIAVGDFNGDGISDLAVTNYDGGSITVLLGNGDGTFRAATSLATGAYSGSVAVGDFNGDGIPDLAVTSWGSVTVLLGNGDGTFTPTATSPATGSVPWSVAVGDFNGDGIPDLAVADCYSWMVTVLLGNGDGTFTPTATSPATDNWALSVAVGDFNGDGAPDLAAVNSGTLDFFLTERTQTATAPPTGISLPANTGMHLVEVSYPGDINFQASISGPIELVSPETQTITFANPGTQTYGTPLTLNATASSGLAVSFASTTTSVCTVSGSTATFVIAGTCTIQATEEGNSTYFVATPVSQSFTVNHEAQTITFPAIPTTTLVSGSVILNATASSGLPVSYASTNTSVCTVSGSTITLLNFGTCGIWATQAGNGGFSAAPEAGKAFAVTIAGQTITFPNPGAQSHGNAPFTLNATASSNLPVSYVSTTSPICTVSASTVTLLDVGTCGITATQPGDSDYAAAAAVGITFPVVRGQIITFPAIPATTLVTGSVTLNATASSHLPVSYSSTNTSVCTVSGSAVTLLSFGTCGIVATQAGNGIVPPAPQVGHAFEVTISPQIITFTNPGTQRYGNAPFTLNATASSNLPVSYTSTTPSICTVSGSTVTLLSLGYCGIGATQTGNTYYVAAPEVGHMFLVAKEAQTITFSNPGTQRYGNAPFTLNATASSNLPVSYTSTTPSICTVSGSTVTLLAAGYCGIVATQSGNTYYAVAPEVGHMFLVAKEAQTINFPNPGTQTRGTTVTLNAAASSGLPVSFTSLTPSVCTVLGSALTLSPGTFHQYCGIVATQAGNAYYALAPEVGRMFFVDIQYSY